MKSVKLWIFGMIEILTAVLLFGVFHLPANGNLQEYGRKQDHDSAERYDADGDLSVPIDAQGRPHQFNSSRIESEADRKRKMHRRDMKMSEACATAIMLRNFVVDLRILHASNIWKLLAFISLKKFIYDKTLKRIETMHLFGCAPLTRGSGGSYFTCKAHLVAHARPKSIACCQEGNYCNRNLSVPAYVNVSPEGVIVDHYVSYVTVTVVLYAVLFSLFVGIALLLFWRWDIIVIDFTAEKLKPSLQKSTLQMIDTGEIEKSPMLYDVR
ncbi:hypothetical protein WUBG_06258 [Wuchereria bancrofti]|uniref:Uncharacterized protein n=1 Tax=Wuchereria bancrofti TaxID=6293 RepID=J9EK38_WUCBA|nr:hypothetical protein WUBG_06258 [Wuchereria bancrofti]